MKEEQEKRLEQALREVSFYRSRVEYLQFITNSDLYQSCMDVERELVKLQEKYDKLDMKYSKLKEHLILRDRP